MPDYNSRGGPLEKHPDRHALNLGTRLFDMAWVLRSGDADSQL
jgi:hypothetical protein